MVPDLSGLAYLFLAAYAALLLLPIVTIAAAGYLVGRWRGVRIGLLVGVISIALIVAAQIFLGVGSWIHYVTATVAAIAVTVAVTGRKT